LHNIDKWILNCSPYKGDKLSLLLNKVFQINFTLAKWCYGLFLLGLLVSWVYGYFITDCIEGAMSYKNCSFNGRDVSAAVNYYAWLHILLFVAGTIFTVVYKLFELLQKQYNKLL